MSLSDQKEYANNKFDDLPEVSVPPKYENLSQKKRMRENCESSQKLFENSLSLPVKRKNTNYDRNFDLLDKSSPLPYPDTKAQIADLAPYEKVEEANSNSVPCQESGEANSNLAPCHESGEANSNLSPSQETGETNSNLAPCHEIGEENSILLFDEENVTGSMFSAINYDEIDSFNLELLSVEDETLEPTTTDSLKDIDTEIETVDFCFEDFYAELKMTNCLMDMDEEPETIDSCFTNVDAEPKTTDCFKDLDTHPKTTDFLINVDIEPRTTDSCFKDVDVEPKTTDFLKNLETQPKTTDFLIDVDAEPRTTDSCFKDVYRELEITNSCMKFVDTQPKMICYYLKGVDRDPRMVDSCLKIVEPVLEIFGIKLQVIDYCLEDVGNFVDDNNQLKECHQIDDFGLSPYLEVKSCPTMSDFGLEAFSTLIFDLPCQDFTNNQFQRKTEDHSAQGVRKEVESTDHETKKIIGKDTSKSSETRTNKLPNQINPTTQSQTNPTQSQTNPTESQTNPTKKQTNPTESQTNPTERQINPTESQINPTGSQTNSTENRKKSKKPEIIEIQTVKTNFDPKYFRIFKSKNSEMKEIENSDMKKTQTDITKDVFNSETVTKFKTQKVCMQNFGMEQCLLSGATDFGMHKLSHPLECYKSSSYYFSNKSEPDKEQNMNLYNNSLNPATNIPRSNTTYPNFFRNEFKLPLSSHCYMHPFESKAASRLDPHQKKPSTVQMDDNSYILRGGELRITRYFHAAACTTKMCSLSFCKPMQYLVYHLKYCETRNSCPVEGCNLMKSTLNHWKECVRDDCSLCVPMRKKLVKTIL